MAYKVFDEVTVGTDRLCIYFDFHASLGIKFAIKQSCNGIITQIKDQTLVSAIAWTGFNKLCLELLKSPKFSGRYKPNLTTIIDNELAILNIQSRNYFLVCEMDNWHAYESTTEHAYLQRDDVDHAIKAIMGINFIETHEKFIKDEREMSENFKSSISDFRKFNQDLIDGKLKDSTVEPNEIVVVDINESTCSVVC